MKSYRIVLNKLWRVSIHSMNLNKYIWRGISSSSENLTGILFFPQSTMFDFFDLLVFFLLVVVLFFSLVQPIETDIKTSVATDTNSHIENHSLRIPTSKTISFDIVPGFRFNHFSIVETDRVPFHIVQKKKLPIPCVLAISNNTASDGQKRPIYLVT